MVPRIPAEFFMASIVTAIESPIESPCNKVCVVDPVAKLCVGCGRSLDEIARWIDLDAAERTRIMAMLPSRLETMRLATMSATAKA
jgi:uncharacterized protein